MKAKHGKGPEGSKDHKMRIWKKDLIRDLD